MADSEHEVKILVTAEVREFQKQMKEAGSSTRDLQKMSTRFRKDGVKGHKDISAASKMIQKGQKQQANEALKHERQLQAEITKTARALREKAKAFKGNADAVKEEIHSLKQLEAELAKSMALRHELGHKSLRERTRGMGGRALGAINRGGGALAMSALGVGAGIAGAVGGFMFGQANQAYSARERFELTQGQLAGIGRPGQYTPGAGARFGYSVTDTAGQAAGIGRATGNIGAVSQAQGLSRAVGMDVGEAGALMGILRGSGHQFTGAQGRGGSGADQLKKIIAAGFESGLERARMPEFIQGVGELVQSAQSGLAGGVGAEGFSQLLGMMGRTGLPGMQGAHGAAVLSRLDAGIKGPGGGEAGRAIMLQALGFGTPGGGRSYVEALEQQEKGASDPSNVLSLIDETASRYGMGSDGQLLALREMTGLGIGQSRAVVDAFGSQGRDGAMAELERQMEAAKSVEEQGLDQMKGIGETLKHVAHLENRLVEMGAPIMESVRDMQRVLNETVEASWPVVVSSLKTIAEVIVELRDLIAGWLGPSQTEQTAASVISKSENVQSQLSQLIPQSGSLPLMEDSAVLAMHEQVNRLRFDTNFAADEASRSPALERTSGGTPVRGDTVAEQVAYTNYQVAQANRRLVEDLSQRISQELHRRQDSAADSAATRTVSAQTTATGGTPESGTPTRSTSRAPRPASH